MVDNTLPTLSLEVKPRWSFSSELVPPMTHGMMEGNGTEEEKKKEEWQQCEWERDGQWRLHFAETSCISRVFKREGALRA